VAYSHYLVNFPEKDPRKIPVKYAVLSGDRVPKFAIAPSAFHYSKVNQWRSSRKTQQNRDYSTYETSQYRVI
jgi:hypothetical protein